MNLSAQRQELEEGLDNLKGIFDEAIKDNEVLRRTNKELREEVIKLTPLKEENARLKERILKGELPLDEALAGKPKLDIEPETVFYHTGQLFIDKNDIKNPDADVFLLAQVDNSEVNLISMQDGNRWSDTMKVDNRDMISKIDFHKHFNSSSTEWILKP